MRFAPDYRSTAVIGAIDRITDRLMTDLIKSGELDLAQQVFARLEQEYRGDRLEAITKWNAEFLKMAQAKQDQAIAALEEKDYRAARLLARESIYLKPTIEGGKQLIRKVDSIYPLVRVGVLQTATVLEPTRLDNWGARSIWPFDLPNAVRNGRCGSRGRRIRLYFWRCRIES